jgi:predicted RecB family nuclease
MNKNGFLRKSVTLMCVILIGVTSYGQSLEETIRMAENQRYESARESFRKLIVTQPKNGNVYYYFGETFLTKVKMTPQNWIQPMPCIKPVPKLTRKIL